MSCRFRSFAALSTGIATLFVIVLWTTPASLPAADAKPAATPAAQTQPPSEPDQKAINDAIDALSSADPVEREKATKKLWSAGAAAERLLREALAKGELDPEQARRGRELLRNFELGLYPDTPASVLELVEEYRRGTPQTRRTAAQQLVQEGPIGAKLAVRLFWTERDGQLRAIIRQTLARQLRRQAAGLLARGDYEGTESLLRVVTSAPEAGDESVRDLAAFLAARGTLAKEIQRLSSGGGDAAAPANPPTGPALTPETSPPRSPHALAIFYRAAGDLTSAIAAAREAQDQRLIDSLLVERRDWTAAATDAVNRRPTDIEGMGYAAAYSRLAGDDAEASKWCDKIAALVAPSRNPQEYEVSLAAEGLLLNERPEPAIDVLKKNHQFAEASKYLRVRLQFDQFIEVNAQAERDGTQSQAALATAEGAAVKILLGETDAARTALASVSKLLSEPANVAILPGRRRPDPVGAGRDDALLAAAAIVQATARLGDPKLLDRYTVAALERTEPANVRATATIFASAADAPTRRGGGGFGDGQSAARWWVFLRGRYHEPVKLTLDRLRAVFDKTLPEGELDALAKAAEQDSAKMRPEERNTWLGDVADALLARGRREDAKKLYQRLGFGTGAADFVIRLADLESEDGHWAEAAELYGRAWEMDPAQPAPALLRGAALLKLGREKEGRELIELAHVIPLSDEGRRRAVFLAAEQRKLPEEMARELELTERTGAATSWERSDVLRRGGDAANERRDYAAAVRLWEQAFIINLDKIVAFVEPAANLTMPALLLRTRALAAIQAGDAAGGLALAKRALSISPGDTDALIDIVNLLDETGHTTEANDLYQITTALYRQLCDHHPRSASLHNQFAWAAAKCKRDADDALAHAKRAVELAPDDAAIIDTLGEAQYQKGDVGAAIETAKRCIELEPTVKHHREQLARFEAALHGGAGGK